jgi:hypothetical protein
MLAFALNSIAYVTHHHDAIPGHALHGLLCGYCVSFDNMTSAPAIRSLAVEPAPTAEVLTIPTTAVVFRFAHTSAQPRAPPLS